MARSKVALWGALSVLVLGVGALVAVSAGGDETRALLPLAIGGGDDRAAGGSMAAPEGAADAMLYQPVHFVAGADLPLLGGDGPVYRLAATADEADVRRLADALGLEGSIEREDETLVVRDDDGQLWVYGANWNYARQYAAGGGSSGVATGCAVPEGEDVAVDCAEPVEPERPADLPSEDEARRIALDIFERAGIDTEDATIRVEDWTTSWGVWVEPSVDGHATTGLTHVLSVGSAGRINDGSGVLGTFERVDDYPLIDTHEAVDKLNEYGGSYLGGPVPLADTGGDVAVSSGGAAGSAGSGDDSVASDGATSTDEAPTTTVATDDTACIMIYPPPPECGGGDEPAPDPDEPACKPQPDGREICEDPATTEPGSTEPSEPAPTETTVVLCEPQSDGTEPCLSPEPTPEPDPEPIDVTLTEAEVVLGFVGAWDGSASYLVPAYRMHGADANGVEHDAVALAIEDEFLQPPTTTVPRGEGTEPAPATTEELQPALSSGEPEIGVHYYAEMITHCGWVHIGDTWWSADGQTPFGEPWNEPTEGGTFTRLSEDTAEFVGDRDPTTKYAKLVRMAQDPGGCD